jgi:hypothetical protein
LSSLPMARPKLWRQRPSASGNITPTTWKKRSDLKKKWCECAISGSLLSGGCGTVSTTVAAAP